VTERNRHRRCACVGIADGGGVLRVHPRAIRPPRAIRAVVLAPRLAPRSPLVLLVLCALWLSAPVAHAAQVQLLTVDDLGTPLPVRMHIRDSHQRPYPGHADSVLMSHGALGSYFYSPGAVTLELPLGVTDITVGKGFEWRVRQFFADIQSDTTLVVTLEHPFDLRPLGWYAGDTHVHTHHPPYDLPPPGPAQLHRIALCEDLAVIWALDQGYEFTGGPHAVSTPEAQLYFTEEYRNGALGHAALLGLKALRDSVCCYLPDAAYPMLGNMYDSWGPDWDEAMVLAHPHTGVDFFDDHDWPGNGLARELPVLAARGRLDALDIASYSNQPDWVAVDDWYDLLNCGLRVPPSAGTDIKVTAYWRPPAGGYRVYVKETPGLPHDAQAWVAGLKAGRSFVTNYPLIPYFAVNGVETGGELAISGPTVRLQINFQVQCALPVETAWLIRNGEALRAIPLPSTPQGCDFDTTLSVDVTESAWFALRVDGESELRHPASPALFAHTGPVYVTLNGRDVRKTASAGRMLDWVDTLQIYVEARDNWEHPGHRAQVLQTIGVAREFYRGLFTAPPAAFALLTPGDGDTLDPHALVHFSWAAAVDPEPGDRVVYRLELAPDSTFADSEMLYVGAETSTDLGLAPPVTTRRWWRVTAEDRGGNITRSVPLRASFVMIIGPESVDGDPDPGGTAADAGPRIPRIEAWPNPAPGAIRLRVLDPPASAGALEIVDLCGRRIARLALDAAVGHAQPRGELVLRWDGRDSLGRPVASGCYWARLLAAPPAAARALAVKAVYVLR
jgi:hypothetical protein